MVDKFAKVSVSSANVLSVDPDPIDCGKRPGHDMDIEWQIVTPGWKFTQTGIVHKDNNDGTFHHPQPGEFNFHWMNGNHHARHYHYIVNVVSTDGKTSLTLDPAIHNHGDSVGS